MGACGFFFGGAAVGDLGLAASIAARLLCGGCFFLGGSYGYRERVAPASRFGRRVPVGRGSEQSPACGVCGRWPQRLTNQDLSADRANAL